MSDKNHFSQLQALRTESISRLEPLLLLGQTDGPSFTVPFQNNKKNNEEALG